MHTITLQRVHFLNSQETLLVGSGLYYLMKIFGWVSYFSFGAFLKQLWKKKRSLSDIFV